MLGRPTCVLFGSGPPLDTFVRALRRSDAAVVTFEGHINGAFEGTGARVDYVFVSTALSDDEIRRILADGKDHNSHLRVILVDPDGDFDAEARELPKLSLVTVEPENAETVANYWAACLYPRPTLSPRASLK